MPMKNRTRTATLQRLGQLQHRFARWLSEHGTIDSEESAARVHHVAQFFRDCVDDERFDNPSANIDGPCLECQVAITRIATKWVTEGLAQIRPTQQSLDLRP